MLRVAKFEAKSNAISQMGTADVIVRNDEVVGSIPTSSTISHHFEAPLMPFRYGKRRHGLQARGTSRAAPVIRARKSAPAHAKDEKAAPAASHWGE